MSIKACKRVSFSPDRSDKPTILLKHGDSCREDQENTKRVAGVFILRLPKCSMLSPARLLRRLRSKVSRALQFVSMRRKRSSRNKICSSSLVRSRSLAESVDSHRAEAIEDCIEFLNSSSSLQRSNSVISTNSCLD